MLNKEKFIKVCDILIEAGIISILSLVIFTAKSISFQESLVLFIFLCVFLFGYLRLKTKYVALTFIMLMIVGMSAIALQVYENILINLSLPNDLWDKFIQHSNRPPFQIWAVFIIMLGLYYLYKKWEARLGKKKLIIENISILLASIIIYDLTLSLTITVKRYDHTYSLLYTSLFLFGVILVWAFKLMAGGNLVFFHKQFFQSYLYTSICLLLLTPFLFLTTSPFYPLDLTHQKGMVQSILCLLLFTLLICTQVSTGRKRGRLKTVLSIILGMVILISWIYGTKIFESFPKFELFELWN